MITPRIALRNYKDFEGALEEEARLFEEANSSVRVERVPGAPITDRTADGGICRNH
jgi:hypothetical protein